MPKQSTRASSHRYRTSHPTECNPDLSKGTGQTLHTPPRTQTAGGPLDNALHQSWLACLQISQPSQRCVFILLLAPPSSAHPRCSRRLSDLALTTVQTVLTMPFTISSNRTTRKPVRSPLPCPVLFSRVPAMFYIGSNVLDWPLEAQRGLADSHEICVREYPLLPLPSFIDHSPRHLVTSLQSVLPSFPPSPFTLFAVTALTNEEVFAEFYYSKSCPICPLPLSSLW